MRYRTGKMLSDSTNNRNEYVAGNKRSFGAASLYRFRQFYKNDKDVTIAENV